MHDHSPSLGSGGIISLWEEREGKSNERRERKGMREGGGRNERRRGKKEGTGMRGEREKKREDISQPHRVQKANLASDRIS